jgi:uncharacterized protein YyaL (SSP411 family)
MSDHSAGRPDEPGNTLANAASSYLRSAAHQPVRWREWGDEAFETAKREDKPILLDIGAVWCHWCHVMDRESYESPAIAEIINRSYVPVKVDRDERPDIDARYQMAVSALTGQGGWPLTAFLTPDGRPFYGGTYFPPDDSHGRPGMRRVLESIAHNFHTHRSEILSSAEKIAEALGGAEAFTADGQKATAALVGRTLDSIRQMFDPQHGGFGHAPKFPHPAALDLLLDAYLDSRQQWMVSAVTTTLEAMGRGGVYDQIGGGFHRYSVDERWIVPHFEKMSYDNAGLLINYLHTYQVNGDPFFREIAQGILSYIETVLSAPDGGFYASQDADYSLDDDGDFFTWTLPEVRAALDEREAAVVAQYYDVEPAGEMHHNPAKNVLYIAQPVTAIAVRLNLTPEEVEHILVRAKRKLLAARANRPTPFVDPTIYASWNGMMASALLESYRVLGDEGARDRALQTLDLLLAKTYDPAQGMYHSLQNGQARIEGLLEDQVFIAAALLDAYEVTGRAEYYERALDLAEITVRRFWDQREGGFFDTAKDLGARQGNLSMPRKAFQDSPTPAANSVAAKVLDRLARLAERPDFGAKAEQTLDIFSSRAAEYGLHAATYAQACVNHFRPDVEVVVVGAASDPATRVLLRAAYETPRAGKHVFSFDPAAVKAGKLPAGLASTLPNLPLDTLPVALICVGTACQPPVHTPEALTDALSQHTPALSYQPWS